MDRLKVIVHGAVGKMGQEVIRAVCRDPELEAVAGVDIYAEGTELRLPPDSRVLPLSADLESTLIRYRPHVMVDFTVANATIPAVRVAAKHNVNLVIGTTGLTEDHLNEMQTICHDHGIGAVIAPNFAVAAVVMMHLSKIAARYFDYAEIIEMHHEQKLDAPSGTALTTAKEMVQSRGRPFDYAATASETVAGSRGGEYEGVALHSVRLPGLLAHQEVILGAKGQTLKIRLDQINREAFMPGVILAIKRVVKLKEAVFGLDKLLGLEEV